MREKLYKVMLTQAERDSLVALTKQGNHPARQITRANILLFLDQKPEGEKFNITPQGNKVTITWGYQNE